MGFDIGNHKFITFTLLLGVVLAFLCVWVWFGKPGFGVLNLHTVTTDVRKDSSDDSSLELKVNQLKTTYASNSLSPVYPPKIGINVDRKFADKLDAFGVIEMTVVGPKDWIGHGEALESGHKTGYLYPVGGSITSGENIKIIATPSCIECVYTLASPYFPNARIWLKDNSFPVNVAVSELILENKSPKLVIYKSALKNEEGMYINGVVYFDENITGTNPAVPYFLGMETTMRENHQELAKTLIDIFIQRKDLK